MNSPAARWQKSVWLIGNILEIGFFATERQTHGRSQFESDGAAALDNGVSLASVVTHRAGDGARGGAPAGIGASMAQGFLPRCW